MIKGCRKVAIVIGMVGIMGIGNMLPANAIEADVNTDVSDVTNTDSSDNKETNAGKTQNDPVDDRQDTEKIADSIENIYPESNTETKTENESIVDEKLSVPENSQPDASTDDSARLTEQTDSVADKTDLETVDDYSLSKLMTGGISYYLNMKRYESLSTYYQKMDDLLLRKTEIYKMLVSSGELTELSVRQIETQEKQISCQKSVCSNEAEYNKFVISKLGLSFDDVDVKAIKSVGNIESYTAGKSEYDAVNIARYVTDCKNAISNISAKEAEVETLNAAKEQVEVLKKAGEASELDVIDSELSLLKAQVELEGYYYDMNVNYCLLK